jgi:hypothetical protein
VLVSQVLLTGEMKVIFVGEFHPPDSNSYLSVPVNGDTSVLMCADTDTVTAHPQTHIAIYSALITSADVDLRVHSSIVVIDHAEHELTL